VRGRRRGGEGNERGGGENVLRGGEVRGEVLMNSGVLRGGCTHESSRGTGSSKGRVLWRGMMSVLWGKASGC